MATEKRLVDAYSVIRKIDNYYNNSPFPHPGTTWLRGLELATGLLLAEPTVDAVEVVRCKDCARADLYSNRPSYLFCMEHHRLVEKDDFCSYGERKEND